MEITRGNASVRLNPFVNDELTDDECAKLRYLSHLYVDPEHRRNGQATELIKQVIKEASEAGITLLLEPKPYQDEDISLTDLIKFYAKHGFVRLQKEPLIMVKYPTTH